MIDVLQHPEEGKGKKNREKTIMDRHIDFVRGMAVAGRIESRQAGMGRLEMISHFQPIDLCPASDSLSASDPGM